MEDLIVVGSRGKALLRHRIIFHYCACAFLILCVLISQL